MLDEKRKNRGYKTTDKIYKAAMRQAKKDKLALAQIIEQAIRLYGEDGYWPDFMQIEDSIAFNNS